jgi:hypothetical protein
MAFDLASIPWNSGGVTVLNVSSSGHERTRIAPFHAIKEAAMEPRIAEPES